MRTMLRGKVTLLFMVLGMLIALPAAALAADLQTSATLQADPAGLPSEVEEGNNAFTINLWATGNLPDNRTGEAHVVNKYFMANDGTITPSSDVADRTKVTFADNTNYSNSTTCPATNATLEGCASNPFEISATLVVAAGTQAGTNGTLTVQTFGSNSLTADATGAQGHVTVIQSQQPTSLSLSANPTSGLYYGDNVDLTATLTKTSDSTAISGKLITFKEGTDTLGTATTNGSGEATISKSNLSVGSHSITASFAGDNDYLASTSNSVSVNILAWTLNGFYQPVDGPNTMNYAKGGSTVPLKFEVFRNLTELTSTSVVSAFTQKVNCDPTLQGDPIEQYSTGATELRYDSTSGQFIFNWKTPKAPGSCYLVTMKTQDGSSTSASFQLK